MVITEEFKQAIIEEIHSDADFGVRLFKAIMVSSGDQLVTKTYLDNALARQSKEFDEKLARQSKDFDEKLTRALTRQSKDFDEKLAQQSERLTREFDEKLARHTGELKAFIDRKLGYIGSRWGEKVEDNYRRFAEKIVAQWGGTVSKWRRKIKTTDDQGRRFIHRYEVDIVVTNGKIILIEMKSQCDLDGVERFLDNIEQYMYLEQPSVTVEKVIPASDITTPARL